MTKQQAIERMTKAYSTIEKAREEYRKLVLQASSLAGTHVAVSPNGKLSVQSRCMFQEVEADAWYWF
jgi:hypothetical protein